ncbi:hypothetical protein J6590_057124 [Homalodisca vitripennis]|nr:hypothetical protein J6590_057124 [Homalodisca vitripennis]
MEHYPERKISSEESEERITCQSPPPDLLPRTDVVRAGSKKNLSTPNGISHVSYAKPRSYAEKRSAIRNGGSAL